MLGVGGRLPRSCGWLFLSIYTLQQFRSISLLKCNQDKFQAMRLGPRHKKKEMNLNIKDINIKSSSGIDLLGVAIDDELNFTKHINNVCTKAARKVGVLMRFRNLIPTEAKLRIFKAFILPQVTYCHISGIENCITTATNR